MVVLNKQQISNVSCLEKSHFLKMMSSTIASEYLLSQGFRNTSSDSGRTKGGAPWRSLSLLGRLLVDSNISLVTASQRHSGSGNLCFVYHLLSSHQSSLVHECFSGCWQKNTQRNDELHLRISFVANTILEVVN